MIRIAGGPRAPCLPGASWPRPGEYNNNNNNNNNNNMICDIMITILLTVLNLLKYHDSTNNTIMRILYIYVYMYM